MGTLSSDNSIPLVVDLDGTLINTDLLYEGIVVLIKKNFLYIFLLLPWFLKGKAYMKNKIFRIATMRPELLPYNRELLEFLYKEAANGRVIVLATASPTSNANEISKVHPIFKQVFGTDETNLKGKNKLKILVNIFGEKKFDYIGNSNSDLRIFASSRYSYLANASNSLKKKTKKISNLQFTWNSGKGSLRYFLKATRPYQWVKNLLVFVPLITAHKFNSLPLISQTFCAFIAFSFVASSGYLINDLSDLNSDRSHPRKRFRPLASGQLSILSGAILALFLIAGGLYIASKLSFLFLIILLAYFVTSLSYSLYFKKAVLYDVFILALLYSIRVFAGGEVIGVQLSFWLIAFSTLIFLSLAFVKRYSELMQVNNKTGLISRGREYYTEDLHLLQVMGIVSGFSSVIVFSLYIDSPEVAFLYSKPKLLWVISLLFLFWINRIWLVTVRGKMTDDPIIFSIKDVTSYILFFFVGLILFVSL
jgi:4-hydroxybenzoate polyprenyltransferase/phosphoserine phosphatase